MFSRISTAVCSGIEGRPVSVETDVARGLPGINIVGLASTMVMESRERIKSAIINSGFAILKMIGLPFRSLKRETRES